MAWVMKVLYRYKVPMACLVLFVLPFVFFWQIWLPGPSQRLAFEFGDFDHQNYPIRRFVAQTWREGRVPLWDPYTFGGQPAAASSLFQTFYPLGLWQVVFREVPRLALELEAVAHLGLAGVFTFLFLRRLTGSTGAAFLGGLTFSWGGLLTSWPTLQFWIVETMVWLPAGLWLMEEGFRRRSLRWVGLAAVPYAFSILAGHGQTVLYSAYLSAAFLAWRWWALRLPWRFVTCAGALVGIGALGLSAVQWLPSVEQMPLSQRAAWTYGDLAHGFQPRELWGILRPNLGEWSPLYVGRIPLALAVACPWLVRRADRRLDGVVFWWAIAIVSLGLALGGNGLLYPLFYRFAPGFDVFRHQERIAYLFSFSLATLGALGYQAIQGSSTRLRWVLGVVALLTALDLYHASAGVILAPIDSRTSLEATPAATFLEQQLAAPETRFNSEGLLPGIGNTGLVYRLRDVTGNNPIRLASYELTLQLVPEVRWWQLFNVAYVVTERTFDYPGISQAFEDTAQNVRIHHLDLGGAPVWITHAAVVMPNQEAAIYYTSDLGLVDPTETVVLEVTPVPAPEPALGTERAKITGFYPERIESSVELAAPAVVVYSEIDYPGWVAYANGERIETLRAFGLLRAVALPAGSWDVVWHFRPLTVYIGAAITALSLVGLAVFLVIGSRTVRGSRDTAGSAAPR